jgi:hypothetical protein
MTYRRNRLGFGVALSLAWFCFGAQALAQDEPAPTPAPAGADDAAAKPADAPAGTPAAEPAVDPAKVATEAAPPEPVAPPTETTATGTSVEREKAVSLVALEQLPGSAYPSAQIRGIKYGSLWLTFHGQQWPYMPAIGGKPGMRIGFSGSIWNDVSYSKLTADPSLAGAKVNDLNRWATQTRGVLRVTPTYNAKNGWFAQGNAEFVVHGDSIPDIVTGVLGTTDDLYVRVGKWNVFDVTVGRFQGWEIANHYGMGLDQNTLERSGARFPTYSNKPTDGYGLSYFWDRQDYLLGGYAVHVYPTKYLRAEVLGHLGAGNNTSNPNQFDIRPSAIFDVGYLKLKAGLEYGKAIPQDKTNKVRDSRNGYGFAAQFVLNPYIEGGASFARGFNDKLDEFGVPNLTTSNTVQTVGGFLNGSPGYEPLVLGFGAFFNHWENLRIDTRPGVPHSGKVDTNDQVEIFGAVQYTLFEQLYFKFVLSHASNHVEDAKLNTYTNTALSGRFRMMILF